MANKKSVALRNKFWNSDLLNLTVGLIDDYLGLTSKPNTVHSDRSIICSLLNASTTRTTINHVSNSGYRAVEGTVRYRLRDLEVDEVQAKFNQMLKDKAGNLPKTLKLAIDYVLIPFYGEELDEGDTVRTKAKQGTTRFFAYASIYVIKKNKRYTLALKYCRKGEKLTDVVDFLLREVECAGFQVETLYLDRGFFSVEVINHLQRREIPFLMPCVLRGRSGGIRNLFVGRKSYTTQYTMRNQAKEKATFQVNVVVKYSQGKYGRHGIEYFAYAVHNIDIPVNRTFEEYRKRFGIECSHRMMNTARARTTTKKPVLRLLYVGIGFLLMNLWIYLQWTLGVKRRGGRKKATWTFKLMLRQITRRIEDELGFHKWIPTPQ
ncbi:MAG: ISH3 family transposase [Archaeoglobaceae archaeon]